MAESNRVVELREELKAKHTLMGEVFALAGKDMDFSNRQVLEKLGAVDSADAVAKFQQLDLKTQGIAGDLRTEEMKEARRRYESLSDELERPASGLQHPGTIESKARTFGELVVESKEYKAFQPHARDESRHATVAVDISLKTLLETTNGYAPHSPRTGLHVEAAVRPIEILDLIPTRPILQAVDKYMEETTRTHSAAEKSEGAAYAESAFVWTERTQAVEKITDSLPVTDEQLEDGGQLAGILDSRLRFGVRQRLDRQVLVGDGTSPNLSGILDRSTQTQAKGGDPYFDAIFKAITKVRHTGYASPSAVVLHPTDYQSIRLTRTADGRYIMGEPMAAGAQVIFGLPIAISGAITQGTGLVGDFVNFCYIGERRGIQVLVGYVGDQFKEGKRTIRADLRACFTVTRPYAFCTVTGL
jgi:HK97 family phage major capsid protein